MAENRRHQPSGCNVPGCDDPACVGRQEAAAASGFAGPTDHLLAHQRAVNSGGRTSPGFDDDRGAVSATSFLLAQAHIRQEVELGTVGSAVENGPVSLLSHCPSVYVSVLLAVYLSVTTG